MRLPLYTSRDAQSALDKLLADCAADARCHAAYPDLGDRVRSLMRRLEAGPVHTRLVHPRTGAVEDVDVDAQIVARIIFGALYSPMTASILPVLIDRAEHNDFQALLALATAGGGEGSEMAIGMQLSVLCAEDMPRVSQDEIAKASSQSVFGTTILVGQLEACQFWPRNPIDPAYYKPLDSDIPTLVLSGGVDPVTPPVWGESVAMHLRHARHVVVPQSGHGVVGTACGWQLIQAFVDKGTVDGLDTSCATTLHRPPFFLTPAGPDPTTAGRAAAAP
jgi:pimeloyl-ACP methyl ester carboxylesterase